MNSLLRLLGGNTTSILFAIAVALMAVFLFVFNNTTFFSGMQIDAATSTLSRYK